jgi:pimeloyl-ACP methyl ester carboxylesterase
LNTEDGELIDTAPYADIWDDRPAAVLVHGSFAADPAYTWRQQRPLAASYRLLVQHRRGYGKAAARVGLDFGQDVEDTAALLGKSAHLVGYSYGGIIALLTAEAYPDHVRSLTLIEPPAFGFARDHPGARAIMERLSAIYPVSHLTPEAFRAGFLSAISGEPRDEVVLTPEERQAAVAAMSEALPWEAPLDLAAVAATPFPKLVVSGAWDAALEAVAAVLTRELHAELAVIPGSGHAVQAIGEPFNARLLALWQSVDGET